MTDTFDQDLLSRVSDKYWTSPNFVTLAELIPRLQEITTECDRDRQAQGCGGYYLLNRQKNECTFNKPFA